MVKIRCENKSKIIDIKTTQDQANFKKKYNQAEQFTRE